MIQKLINTVGEFHKVFQVPVPNPMTTEIRKKRFEYFKEELEEYIEGFEASEKGLEYFITKNGKYVHTFTYKIDAIVDMLYILAGTAHQENILITSAYINFNKNLPIITMIDYLNDCNSDYVKNEYPTKIVLINMFWILFDLAHAEGIYYCLKELFNEVHRSNLSKLDDNGKPLKNGENGVPFNPEIPKGKIIKSKNFSEPKLEPILIKHKICTYAESK